MRFLYMGVIVPLAVVVPLAVAAINHRYLRRADKIIMMYLLTGGVFNAAGHYLAQRSRSNLFLQHIFTCIEILLVCFFFREILTGKRMKQWLPYVAVIFTGAAIVNSIFIQHAGAHNSYARSAAALLIVSLCFYFFKTKLDSGITWKAEPDFWYVSGFLLYFSSSLFLFILSNKTFVTMSNRQSWTLWNIHATMVLIMYLFIAAGFGNARSER